MTMFKGIYECGRGHCLSLTEDNFLEGFKVGGRESKCLPDEVLEGKSRAQRQHENGLQAGM